MEKGYFIERIMNYRFRGKRIIGSRTWGEATVAISTLIKAQKSPKGTLLEERELEFEFTESPQHHYRKEQI